jgi:DNA-binding transcriptional regulator YiaG
MYHYTDGGLRNVWLVNGYEVRQTPFGEGVVIHDLDGLTRAICLALAEKPASLTGVELRYIRSAGMLLSQPALGRLIGVDGQTVARWEKSGRVPRMADKTVRLHYLAHARGDEPIRSAVERVKTVERLVGQRIVVEDLRAHWEPDDGTSAPESLALAA